MSAAEDRDAAAVVDALRNTQRALDKALGKLAAVEALAEEWVVANMMRSMTGTVIAQCGRDLRAVLADHAEYNA